MNSSLGDEIKRAIFNPPNSLVRIIVINVLVFVVIKLFSVVQFLFQFDISISSLLIKWLSLPANLSTLVFQPWSLFSYMFLHEGFFHILFNMLWLWWFGGIFIEYLGSKKFSFAYLAGGITGGLLYILSFNIFPAFSAALPAAYALGASASVMAVVVATATLLPDYTIFLLFLGPVRIKYIAGFYVLLDLLSIGSINSGGHIAHLGGALLGFLFIRQLKAGNDLSSLFVTAFERLKKAAQPKPKMKVSYRNPTDPNYSNKPDQKVIDAILDKISKSGYDSLSKKEKEILFKVSKEE